MLNRIFLALVLFSMLLAGWTGRMEATIGALFESAKSAVTIAIGLIGVMAFFLGLMKVAEAGGLLAKFSRIISPVMRLFFPGVPAGHPAMAAMILNIASNMLGLANAATPFGIRAMEELDKLNTRKGTATNAMVLFLAINTAGLALLPSGVAGLRAVLGSKDAFGIWLPTLFASGCATVVGVSAVMLLGRLPIYRKSEPPAVDPKGQAEASLAEVAGEDWAEFVEPPARRGRVWAALLFLAVLVGVAVRSGIQLAETQSAIDIAKTMASSWALALIVSGLLLFGWTRAVPVYETLVEGAKEGWDVAKRIIPFLVTILVAVGMFRASGGIEILQRFLGGTMAWIGMPVEALPMAILRPLSGSGAYGIMAEIMETHGPDSLIGYMVSTFQGSTETTFYVLAVYFGAVKVKDTRHALPACLMADLAGILAAVFIVNLLFG